ncbi:MAG: hypothetical protein N4A46_01270, partial [Schleiferiaceae bacterium]|nr:hypothetical protein [Schleiferiaceae bacterium]
MSSQFTSIIAKLNEFINRYYAIRIVRGSILFIALFSLLVILTALSVEYLESDTVTRTVLFVLLLLVGAAQLGLWVIDPILKRFGLSNRLSHKEAGRLITQSNPIVGEKILNGLELNQFSGNNELVIAGLNQLTGELKVFNPKEILNYKRIKQGFWTALPVILLLVLIGITGSTDRLISGSERLVSFNKEYLPKDYVGFELISDQQVKEGEVYNLKFVLKTDVIPERILIEVNGVEVSQVKRDGKVVETTLRNTYKDFSVQCKTDKYESEVLNIGIIRRSRIADYNFKVIPPAYTNLTSKFYSGVNQMMIPENSKVEWRGKILNADSIVVTTSENEERRFIVDDNLSFDKRVGSNEEWNVSSDGETLGSYEIEVLKDEYPELKVEVVIDSLIANRYYFSIIAADDYGIKKLSMVNKEGNNEKKEEISIERGRSVQAFKTVDIGKDQEVYFEVLDNDNYNGFKKTRSLVFELKKVDKEELKENSSKSSRQTQKEFKESVERKSELDNTKEEKDREDQLNDERENLEDLLRLNEEIKKEFEFQRQNELYDEEILEKQNQVEERLNEVDEDIRELLKEIEELQRELYEDQEIPEDVEIKKEDIEDELDRMMELLDRLQFEKDVEDLIDKLDQLEKKQDDLANENNESVEDQEKLNKELEEVKKELENIEKKADELAIDEFKSLEKQKANEAESQMNEASENQKKGKKSKANQNQKKASEKLSELSQSLK